MRISVVIPTIGRWLFVKRCLEALKQQQKIKSFEVIIVDDSPSSNMEASLAPYRTELNLKYIRHNYCQGPGVARNTGASLAEGEVIAFLDDDAIPATDWLYNGLTLFQKDVGLAMAVGRIVLPPGEPINPLRHVMIFYSGKGFPACNMWVRRQVFFEVGGFSEQFFDAEKGVYHYEDVDLALRFIEKKKRVIYAPNLVVFHPSYPRSWFEPIKMARKAYFEPLLAKRHPKGYAQLRTQRLGPIIIRNARTRFRWVIALLFLLALVFSGLGLWRVAGITAILGGIGVICLFLRKCNVQGLRELGPFRIILAIFLEFISVYCFIGYQIRGMFKHKYFLF